MNRKSIINLENEDIENVRQFKYLGHMLSNVHTITPSFITNQISSAYQKWNELKSMLLDKRIHLPTRIKFLEAYIRSRLLYSVQAWQLNTAEMRKIESVWNGFLRRMVKGGFRRRNAPRDVDFNPEDSTSWAYIISNDELKRITNTTDIKVFCKTQHLKYIAHVMRSNNDILQKQFLFIHIILIPTEL